MTPAARQPCNVLHQRAWVRHGAAVALTLAVNAAVVLFLVAWRGRSKAGPRPLIVVPMSLVKPEPEPVDLRRPDQASQAVPAAPASPALPAPPIPAMPTVDLSLKAPSPLEIPVVSYRSTGLPVYVPRLSRPAPAGATAAPSMPGSKLGMRSGVALIQPPDLSGYYPRRARMRGITGVTTIEMTVTATGSASNVLVITSTPEGAFETAARRVGRTLRFRPAVRDGKAVPATVRLRLKWRLE